MSSCGPWQMAATGLPASIASRARSTIAWRMRILSGAWPPGITSASKSVMRAAPAARSATTIGLAALAAVLVPVDGADDRHRRRPPRAARSSGPVSSRSSNSSSTSIATRLPVERRSRRSCSAILPQCHNRRMNRLARERSPYLLQHAHNPVDWFPWGDEAFAKARGEDKPIFLSIGYSTCHWCHVMEHESFENADDRRACSTSTSSSIKVDREERPDVDRVYMTFVQATTGSGGWPMSVWLTPDLKPFYGGTYFPADVAVGPARVRRHPAGDRARLARGSRQGRRSRPTR